MRLADHNLARASGAEEVGITDREDVKVRAACRPELAPRGESAIGEEGEWRSAR